ncbi:glycoprotein-N-acetylgalactosamine 3-beta-galactosyltransferase 1-like [Chironomus tepperi]|uniref:glycoprotein-N-acetylgalactosamine 3-beta-galactosyltransferase 1-like n=1 Tax=Chironomus tepperi TaxID=113505 RepID=UPI00391F91D2
MVKHTVMIFAFLIGFVIGVELFLWIFSSNISLKLPNRFIYIKSKSNNNLHKYDTSLADKLYDEVKILCLIITQPSNHQTKAIHVNNTWGYKCNKLIFLSTQNVTNFETFNIPYNESRAILWGKVRNGFEQAFLKYHNDYDWFLKGDDDSYFIMENLRQMLYQYNSNTSIIVGHKYVIQNIEEGYMAGAGYVLSRKALEKLSKVFKNSSICRTDNDGAEDAEMGKCLKYNALFLDGHDIYGEKQFFPVDVTEHMSNKEQDYSYWYTRNEWFNSTHGGLKCCSRNIACMHYITPTQMYRFNYLINNLHPFGLQNEFDLKLPKKLEFKELVDLADEKSSSPNYVIHKIEHNFDKDEVF